MYKLSSIYKRTPTGIMDVLKRGKIQSRNLSEASQKHSLNKDYFKKINNQNKAYFLGLLYADGNLSKSSNNISISLDKKDKHILDKFKEEINSSRKIKLIIKDKSIFKRKDQYRLDITNKIFYKHLLDKNLHPNKSLTLKYPKIETNLQQHFIRGYFDGDGCVYSNPKKYDYLVSFVGTKEFLLETQKHLIKNCKLNKTKLYNPKTQKGNNVYILTYQGRKSVKKIQEFLYKNSSIYLTRKYKKFKSI